MYIALIVPTVIPTWYLVICHLCQLWTSCQMPPVPVMNFLPDATCASYEVPARCHLCQLWSPCQMPPVPVINFLPDATCASYEVPASCRKTHVLRLMFRGLKTWEPVSITCATRAKSHTYRSITFSSLKQPNPLSALLSSLNLDNCNSLLSGCPQYLLDKFQKLQNVAARLVCKAKKSGHIHSILETLHQLPVTHRVQHKMSTIFFNSKSVRSKLWGWWHAWLLPPPLSGWRLRPYRLYCLHGWRSQLAWQWSTIRNGLWWLSVHYEKYNY